MAELKTDRELLRDYAEGGSEGAFQALVARHLDLVFATALRGLNHNAEAAQEISQNVFIALARKASWLAGETSVAGWLHKTALLEIRRWWRGELRRQRREQAAVELGTTMKEEDSLLKALAGELDEGLLGLRESERQALMLRYFQGRSYREIGVLLGARDDAVRMRIDKALTRLTQFFRRRGYAVPAVATTVAVLGSAAKAAPAGFTLTATHAALAAASSGGAAATGLKVLIAKVMALTQTQTALLCIALAAMPTAWEWHVNRAAAKHAAVAQAQLEAVHGEQARAAAELEHLRAEAARLDAALAEAANHRTRYAKAAAKLENLKAQVRGLLTGANYHWPEDLPYVRVPKSVVKSLDLLHRSPMAFAPSGKISEPALELFGMTAQEQVPAEQALANYCQGAEDLMAAAAYETNAPSTESGRRTKTVIVPPLGQPLKELAQETRARLIQLLGAEREALLFGDWDQGAIQFIAPGNLWKISEEPQTFTVWVEQAGSEGGEPRYGASRSSSMGGVSAEGRSALGVVPNQLATKFFDPWLEQLGVQPGNSHE